MDLYFPYPVLDSPLELLVDEQRVDGLPPNHDLLAVRRSIDLSGLGAGWRRASFEVRLDVPLAALGELGVEVTSAVLTVSCPSTNIRAAVVMSEGAQRGSWRCALDIEAASVARKASLQAILVASIAGTECRYVGSSEEWRVWISPPESPTVAGDLPVWWRDFTSDDRPASIDPVFGDQPYYVDVTADPPCVYLNEGLPDLRRLYDDAPRRSAVEKALRAAHFNAIAASGWMALFNAAIGGIRADDNLVDWPAVEWQERALRTLLPRIYPDLALDDALGRAFEDDKLPEGARVLQSRAAAAISVLLNSGRGVRQAIRSLEEVQ